MYAHMVCRRRRIVCHATSLGSSRRYFGGESRCGKQPGRACQQQWHFREVDARHDGDDCFPVEGFARQVLSRSTQENHEDPRSKENGAWRKVFVYLHSCMYTWACARDTFIFPTPLATDRATPSSAALLSALMQRFGESRRRSRDATRHARWSWSLLACAAYQPYRRIAALSQAGFISWPVRVLEPLLRKMAALILVRFERLGRYPDRAKVRPMAAASLRYGWIRAPHSNT